SILVAFDGNYYFPQAVATAAKLAARRRRGIHVLVTLTVPASAPLNADLPEQELAARAIIEQARTQGGRRVTGHVERVRTGQGGSGSRGDRADGPPDGRLADALRRHLHAAGQRDLLLAGRGDRPRLRPEPGGLPRRRPVLPAGRHDLRRRRVAAPGARRRDR